MAAEKPITPASLQVLATRRGVKIAISYKDEKGKGVTGSFTLPLDKAYECAQRITRAGMRVEDGDFDDD